MPQKYECSVHVFHFLDDSCSLLISLLDVKVEVVAQGAVHHCERMYVEVGDVIVFEVEETESVGDAGAEPGQCGVTHCVVVGYVKVEQNLIAQRQTKSEEMLAADGDFTVQHHREVFNLDSDFFFVEI